MSRIKLYELAHARSGDKGEVTNISLIPYQEEDYDLLAKKVTAEKVKEHFAEITAGEVIRYDMDKLKAFNFVLKGTRPGGVGAALDLDPHGKSLSWALLEMEIEL
jgi:hypothetical protein